LNFAPAIAALESMLGSKEPFDKAALPLAYDAIRGSMYENKYRGAHDEYPDLPRAVARALERLQAMPDDPRPLEWAGDLPPVGIGWGTYGWKGDGLCLRAAIDGGAVLIDTAATYGYGRVERALGSNGVRERGTTWLATKFARNHARRAPVLASLGRSLNALQVERIDLFQLHWPTPAVVPFEETLGAMLEAQRSGKARALGLCNVSVDQLDLARRFAPIAAVQVRLNMYDLSALGPLMDYCGRNDIRLIAHSPCAQGATWKGGRPDFTWFTNRGFIPIPGSNDPEHILENLNANV